MMVLLAGAGSVVAERLATYQDSASTLRGGLLLAGIAGGSSARVDKVIARFNQFNYVGALLGSVLTRVVGQDPLRYGFAVPMVLVLAIIWLARAFVPAHDRPSLPLGGVR